MWVVVTEGLAVLVAVVLTVFAGVQSEGQLTRAAAVAPRVASAPRTSPTPAPTPENPWNENPQAYGKCSPGYFYRCSDPQVPSYASPPRLASSPR